MKLLFQGIFSLSITLLITSCSYSQNKATDAYSYALSHNKINNPFMQVKILSTVALKAIHINSLPVVELSGIAIDKDENILYAISDEGLLYHIKLIIKKDQIKTIKIISATRLKDARGKPLKGKFKDAEGLSLINANNGIHGDTKLIIAFENKPRIARFTTKGYYLADIAIPKKLRKRKNYRDKNKALESVIIHPKYGILTAAEYPLKRDPIKYQSIYSVSKFSPKKVWHFPASKAENSAITDLELLPNGDILVMERAYKNPFTPIVINLRRLKLGKCNIKQECKVENIARFSSADGWLLDNFEGLTHIKDNKYLMVSDNNKNPFQRTIFVLFEIIPVHYAKSRNQ